jgi:hypothetical protein
LEGRNDGGPSNSDIPLRLDHDRVDDRHTIQPHNDTNISREIYPRLHIQL